MTLTTFYGQDDSIITSEKTLHEGFFRVREYKIKFKTFDGEWSQEVTRDLLVRGEASAALLYDPAKDAVVLIEQYRIGAHHMEGSPWLFEIVAGLVDEGEDPGAVAQRESIEEAGCEIKKLIPIYRYLTSPGGTDEIVNLYCGIVDSEGVGGIHGLAEEHEDIKVHVVKADEAIAMIADKRIYNAAAIIALQWLALNRATLLG